MDQSEIDALLAKSKGGQAAPAPTPAPAAKSAPAPKPDLGLGVAAGPERDKEGHVITELDTVTAVTERETNKVMDQLDFISNLVGTQQTLITQVMQHPEAQAPAVQEAVNKIMSAAKDIQNKVYEAMDLMQFQDITRQKLERIVFHLRQIHDYIVDLLGTGLKSEGQRSSISHTIASTGTTPDEKKVHADAVVEEFMRGQQKD